MKPSVMCFLFSLLFLGGCLEKPSLESIVEHVETDGSIEKKIESSIELDTKRMAPPPNTTCKIPSLPTSSQKYGLERSFSNLLFTQPVFLTFSPDDTHRLFVVEKGGKIYVFANQPSTTQKDVFLDLTEKTVTLSESGLLGLAFHPRFQENRYFYVYYSATNPLRSVISRFEVLANQPNKANLASEKIILEIPQPYANHNGGMLAFDEQGYLYLAPGDGGSGGDPHGHGQNKKTWLGSMLRVDVDNPSNGKNYGIPADNPFANDPNALPEIWAIGLRNPWRFSFDPLTRLLWAGDVGQVTKEEINLIEKGGNYGWNTMEGLGCFVAFDCDKTGFVFPLVEHDRNEAKSITGGYVYRGTNLPDLYGYYIYGDYVTGNIWQLKWDGKKIVKHDKIVSSGLNISSFGLDEKGELYVVSYYDGKLYQIKAQTPTVSTFPIQLSKTGCFQSTSPLVPISALVPYEVNVPLWSDGLDKQRWFALPASQTIDFKEKSSWTFPNETILIKHFSYLRKKGDLQSRQSVETRIMVQKEGDWKTYTYVWNKEQTDAFYVEEGSSIEIKQESAGNLLSMNFVHQVPKQSECNQCHTLPADRVLGLTTLQTNRDIVLQNQKVNQLALWEQWNLFNHPLPEKAQKMDKLVAWNDPTSGLKEQVKSYWVANCSFCHMKGISDSGDFQLDWASLWESSNVCRTKPIKGNLGSPENLILVPGKPEHSLLWLRMNTRQANKMPLLGSNVVDAESLEKIKTWILSLTACP